MAELPLAGWAGRGSAGCRRGTRAAPATDNNTLVFCRSSETGVFLSLPWRGKRFQAEIFHLFICRCPKERISALLGFCFSGVLALTFSEASPGEAGRFESVSSRQQISMRGFVLALATTARWMAQPGRIDAGRTVNTQRAALSARAGRRAVLLT